MTNIFSYAAAVLVGALEELRAVGDLARPVRDAFELVRHQIEALDSSPAPSTPSARISCARALAEDDRVKALYLGGDLRENGRAERATQPRVQYRRGSRRKGLSHVSRTGIKQRRC